MKNTDNIVQTGKETPRTSTDEMGAGQMGMTPVGRYIMRTDEKTSVYLHNGVTEHDTLYVEIIEALTITRPKQLPSGEESA